MNNSKTEWMFRPQFIDEDSWVLVKWKEVPAGSITRIPNIFETVEQFNHFWKNCPPET